MTERLLINESKMTVMRVKFIYLYLTGLQTTTHPHIRKQYSLFKQSEVVVISLPGKFEQLVLVDEEP